MYREDEVESGVQKMLSKPQPNLNSTKPNLTLVWILHENNFVHHPAPPLKLNVGNV